MYEWILYFEGFPLNKSFKHGALFGTWFPMKHDHHDELPGWISLTFANSPADAGFSEERLWPDNYLVSWLEVNFSVAHVGESCNCHGNTPQRTDVVMELVEFLDVYVYKLVET